MREIHDGALYLKPNLKFIIIFDVLIDPSDKHLVSQL